LRRKISFLVEEALVPLDAIVRIVTTFPHLITLSVHGELSVSGCVVSFESEQSSVYTCEHVYTANPTWGDFFESSNFKAQKSLLPRFSDKRRSSFEL